MTNEDQSTARKASDIRRPPVPSRGWGKDAGSPFNVHGHRLSSLYRAPNFPANPFNVLKILKKAPASPGGPFEYLRNIERGRARA